MGAARRMPLALGTPGKGNLRMDKGKKGKGVAREKRPATAHGTTNELLGQVELRVEDDRGELLVRCVQVPLVVGEMNRWRR